MCVGEWLCGKKREVAEEKGSSSGNQLLRRNLICPAEGVWVDTWMTHIRSHFLGGLCDTWRTHTFVESFSEEDDQRRDGQRAV